MGIFAGSNSNQAARIGSIYVGDSSNQVHKIVSGYYGNSSNQISKFFSSVIPPALPVFTGSHAIFGDATQGYMECYGSGILTLPQNNYDLHAVGGGASGGAGQIGSLYSGGGGGGYTSTLFNQSLSGQYNVLVGSGGNGLNTGGSATFFPKEGSPSQVLFNSAPIITALGGSSDGFDGNPVSNARGSNGGSGGGGGSYNNRNNQAGDGGLNGSNGGNAVGASVTSQGEDKFYGGLGQGTTTRDFGELTGTLRAGGGGGAIYTGVGGDGQGYGGTGGLGGGANGLSSQTGASAQAVGTPNTGGGGGGRRNSIGVGSDNSGGSGIVIIRWGY